MRVGLGSEITPDHNQIIDRSTEVEGPLPPATRDTAS